MSAPTSRKSLKDWELLGHKKSPVFVTKTGLFNMFLRKLFLTMLVAVNVEITPDLLGVPTGS